MERQVTAAKDQYMEKQIGKVCQDNKERKMTVTNYIYNKRQITARKEMERQIMNNK